MFRICRVCYNSTFRQARPSQYRHYASSSLTQSKTPELSHKFEKSPPASAPSYRDTPSLFKPGEHEQIVSEENIDSLPPRLHQKKIIDKSTKKGNQVVLTAEVVEEIKRLRNSNERKNSRLVLSKKFNCNPSWIGVMAPVSKTRRKELEEELEYKKSKWGVRKIKTRNERIKRRKLWGEDEFDGHLI